MKHHLLSPSMNPCRFLALLASTAVVLIAVSACGSSSSSTTSPPRAPRRRGRYAGSSSPSAAQAKTALAADLATPTKINITTPLKSAPPAGKTIVVLGTTDPANVLIQQQTSKLAGLAHWHYALVSYDPSNPATFNAGSHHRIGKTCELHRRIRDTADTLGGAASESRWGEVCPRFGLPGDGCATCDRDTNTPPGFSGDG